MKINGFSNSSNYTNFSDKSSGNKNINNKFENVKTNQQKSLFGKSNNLNNSFKTYNQNGFSTTKTSQVYQSGLGFDKGTASNTTVYVNREAYDKITYASTFGEPKWEEMGCDDEKRWVVINGQRFECPHSKEEKELRKRLRRGIIEVLEEYDNKKKETQGNYNGQFKPKGNIESLKNNDVVMNLLGKIYNTHSYDTIFSKLVL